MKKSPKHEAIAVWVVQDESNPTKSVHGRSKSLPVSYGNVASLFGQKFEKKIRVILNNDTAPFTHQFKEIFYQPKLQIDGLSTVQP